MDDAGTFTTVARTSPGAYGQGALVLALPLRQVRPYIEVAMGAYSEPKTTAYSSGAAGLAFPLF
jgi:hypothetical protein